MEFLIINLVVIFITLFLVSRLISKSNNIIHLLIATGVYGLLSVIPIPIPLIGGLFPILGIYFSLKLLKYDEGAVILKLCLSVIVIKILVSLFYMGHLTSSLAPI